jgi:hypothetical protein
VFPDFRPEERIQGVFGDSRAVVITLRRHRKKRQLVVFAGTCTVIFTIARYGISETFRVETRGSTWRLNFAGSIVDGVEV